MEEGEAATGGSRRLLSHRGDGLKLKVLSCIGHSNNTATSYSRYSERIGFRYSGDRELPKCRGASMGEAVECVSDRRVLTRFLRVYPPFAGEKHAANRMSRFHTTPEWRFKICCRFCENAERAITIFAPASCACCLSSPCTCDGYPITLICFISPSLFTVEISLSG